MNSLVVFAIAIVLILIGGTIITRTDTDYSLPIGGIGIALGVLCFLIGAIVNHNEHTRRR